MQIFSVFRFMVFVAFISAAPIDDTLQLLQREMKEMKNHYEKIEQKLDSMSVSAAFRTEQDRKIEEQDRKIEEQDKKIELLEGKVNSNKVYEVSAAFSTRLHEETTLSDGPVVFGTINLNIGDGYDEFTGVFEPPVDGVYVLTIYGRTSSVTNGPMYLRNNDDILCSTWMTEDYNLFTTGTCTAVAELVVGDSVRVTGSSENPAVIAGGDSGFTGFIIS